MLFALLLAGLGFVGGFLSGLLGIGGGIVMVPLLLFVPPLIGFSSLDIREVAGITMVQVFVAASLGYAVHRRRRTTAPGMVSWMGAGMVLGTAGGAVLSKYADLGVLEAVFVALALIAAPLLFLPPPGDELGEGAPRDFSRTLAFTAALVIGLLSGLLGIGGAFLVVPVIIYVMGVPTRAAIGSSLGVLLMSSAAGVLVKLGTGQIVPGWAAALCLGTVPGSWGGAHVSSRVPARALRLSLAVLVVLTAVRMLIELVATVRLAPFGEAFRRLLGAG